MDENWEERPFDKFVLIWACTFALLLLILFLVRAFAVLVEVPIDKPFGVALLQTFVLSFIATGFLKWLFWAIEFKKNQKTARVNKKIEQEKANKTEQTNKKVKQSSRNHYLGNFPKD